MGNNSNKMLDGVIFSVNRLGSTLSTSVLSFKLIALIVIEKFLQKSNFSIIMIGSEVKLDIHVYYQMGNPLQQYVCKIGKYNQKCVSLKGH
jgi:hypothetical protein